MTPDQINAAVERGRTIWDDLVKQSDGPLPFVQFDPDDPTTIVSAWDVTESGDEAGDATRGFCYGDLLLHRAKNWRDHGNLAIDPSRIISQVLVDIAQKGVVGPIERGFFSRIAMLALAAAQN
jgi:hypothetical protein